jgi:hypothetical protein
VALQARLPVLRWQLPGLAHSPTGSLIAELMVRSRPQIARVGVVGVVDLEAFGGQLVGDVHNIKVSSSMTSTAIWSVMEVARAPGDPGGRVGKRTDCTNGASTLSPAYHHQPSFFAPPSNPCDFWGLGPCHARTNREAPGRKSKDARIPS